MYRPKNDRSENFFEKMNYNLSYFKRFLEQEKLRKRYVQSCLDSMIQVFTQNCLAALKKMSFYEQKIHVNS